MDETRSTARRRASLSRQKIDSQAVIYQGPAAAAGMDRRDDRLAQRSREGLPQQRRAGRPRHVQLHRSFPSRVSGCRRSPARSSRRASGAAVCPCTSRRFCAATPRRRLLRPLQQVAEFSAGRRAHRHLRRIHPSPGGFERGPRLQCRAVRRQVADAFNWYETASSRASLGLSNTLIDVDALIVRFNTPAALAAAGWKGPPQVVKDLVNWQETQTPSQVSGVT